MQAHLEMDGAHTFHSIHMPTSSTHRTTARDLPHKHPLHAAQHLISGATGMWWNLIRGATGMWWI